VPEVLDRDGAEMMTPDRITAYFFGTIALGCVGAVGYLLVRCWLGQ